MYAGVYMSHISLIYMNETNSYQSDNQKSYSLRKKIDALFLEVIAKKQIVLKWYYFSIIHFQRINLPWNGQ